MKKKRIYRDRVEMSNGEGFDLIWRLREKQGVEVYRTTTEIFDQKLTARIVADPVKAPEGTFYPIEVVPAAGSPFAKGLVLTEGGFKAVRGDAARFLVECATQLKREKKEQAN
jgi:hypothetical protein